MSKITMVGCGVMGSCLINATMNGGHEVTIVDLNKDAALPFIQRGANYSPNLAKALDCKFIVLNVPTYSIATNVINSCPPSALRDKIIVNLITGNREEVHQFQSLMDEVKAIYIDGALECYPSDIGTPTGFITFCGNKKIYETIEDDLKAMSPQPTYLGEDIFLAKTVDLAVLILFLGLTWSVLQSSALCMRNGYPIKDFSKLIYPIMTSFVKGMSESIVTDLDNYTGKFSEATVVSCGVMLEGIPTIHSSLEESRLDTSVFDGIGKLISNTVAEGYGTKNYEAVITQILK